MAENTGKTPGATEPNPTNQLEVMKQEALMDFLRRTQEFMKVDGEINEALKDLLRTVANHANKNPGILFSGGDVEGLFAEFQKARAEGGSPGISGHDIAGGGPIDDIADFIKQLGDFIAKEKKFFIAILLLIFCDNACECLCKYINTPD